MKLKEDQESRLNEKLEENARLSYQAQAAKLNAKEAALELQRTKAEAKALKQKKIEEGKRWSLMQESIENSDNAPRKSGRLGKTLGRLRNTLKRKKKVFCRSIQYQILSHLINRNLKTN